jgi:uncharacterized protein YbcC (UPF0753/DUF2309 family)
MRLPFSFLRLYSLWNQPYQKTKTIFRLSWVRNVHRYDNVQERESQDCDKQTGSRQQEGLQIGPITSSITRALVCINRKSEAVRRGAERPAAPNTRGVCWKVGVPSRIRRVPMHRDKCDGLMGMQMERSGTALVARCRNKMRRSARATGRR